jgi:hypothetical protein
MRSIFQNEEHEKHFQKYGFVKIPFFDTAEIIALTKLCKELNGNFDTPFTTTIWSQNETYRKAVYTELKKIYLPAVQKVFANCQLVMGTILTKHTGEKSEIDIHQDWAFTNEELYPAVNIWVPLTDVNVENGALYFLPFSQQFQVPYRGRHITPQFTAVKDAIWKLGEVCTANAGEAIIFNVKMVHYSNPNKTPKSRTAVSMVAIPEEADILHYINYKPAENIITEMKVDEFFYNNYSHNDTIPKSVDAKEFEFERKQLDHETFMKEYEVLCITATNL